MSGLPRSAWLLALATLINRAGTMALPFLVLYLTRGLGLPAEVAALILGVYGAFGLVAAPFAGAACDRYGAARVMTATLAASGALLCAYPLFRSPVALAVATALLACVAESFRPAAMAAMSDLVPAEQRKQAFSLSRLAVNLGMSVGPALGGLLSTLWFPAIFLVDGATSLLAAGLLVATLDRVAKPPARAEARGRARLLGGLADRPFLLFLAATIVIGAVFLQLDAALPLYMVRDLGISQETFGLVFTLNTLLIVAIEIPLVTMTARWPHPRALVLGAILVALGMGAVALARSAAGVAATVVVWTFGEMTLFPAMSAYAADAAPEGRRGQYMGLYTMAFGLAFTVGPGLGTLVLDRFGAGVLWPCTFAVGLGGACMLAFVPPPRAADATEASA